MKILRKSFLIFVLGLVLVGLPLSVLAAEGDVLVKTEETVAGNFIRFGNLVEIKGAVNGDVIVAGNTILISGTVAGDVIAIGNTIKITGPVFGSVRAAGNMIEISNAVERNVWAVASDFTLTREAKVNWEVNASAQKISIQSPVGGNVWLAASQIDLGGIFSKNVETSLDRQGKLNLTESAAIKGDLVYFAQSDSQLSRHEKAVIQGQLQRKAPTAPSPSNLEMIFGPVFMFLRIVSLFSLLVVGLVLITLFPKMVLQVRERMFADAKGSIGWGLVFFIVAPVLMVILTATIIGFPLALIMLPLYLILLYISKIIAAFAVGLYLFDYFSKAKKFKGHLIWPMVLGLAIVVFVTDLPVLGLLVKLGLIWWALGALINTQKNVLFEWR